MKNLSIVAIVLLLFNGCTKKGENRIFVLPKQFVGYAIIIYDQSDGENSEYINSKRLFRIPSSGVLKTKFMADYGGTAFPEFYYESINEQNRIPLVVDVTYCSHKEVNVSMPNIGKVYPNDNESEPIVYSIFFVGTKQEMERSSNELAKINILELR